VRLFGRRKTGAKVEIFVLNPGKSSLKALVRPSKRVKEGEAVELENGMKVKVGAVCGEGRIVEFEESLEDILSAGHMPLPPYISREDKPLDKETYQTVFALKEGATAAPTAGLHFTNRLLGRIKKKGVNIAYVTLHTNYATFAPVKVEDISDHKMHFEEFEIGAESVKKINKAKADKKKIISVGTTSTRVLESAGTDTGMVRESGGKTNLFIYPGYKFKIVDKLITNFHFPESTLLMLVSAFAGRGFVLKAYGAAVKEKYRFFSYGDAMLIE
jgi:S-adenosylmethionine:tRNA ribosyltransferase-isomerase